MDKTKIVITITTSKFKEVDKVFITDNHFFIYLIHDADQELKVIMLQKPYTYDDIEVLKLAGCDVELLHEPKID